MLPNPNCDPVIEIAAAPDSGYNGTNLPSTVLTSDALGAVENFDIAVSFAGSVGMAGGHSDRTSDVGLGGLEADGQAGIGPLGLERCPRRRLALGHPGARPTGSGRTDELERFRRAHGRETAGPIP